MNYYLHPKRRILKIVFLSLRIFLSYKLLSLIMFFSREESLRKRQKKLHHKNAAMLFEAATSLKGVLIKIGQFLSARVDFLPDEYTEVLSKLQDQIPPADFNLIKKRLIEELGEEPSIIFKSFNEEPIAAASLGQVHEAVLKNCDRVAVKIQYPDIENVVKADLKALNWVVKFLRKQFKDINFDVLLNEFSRILQDELNYIHEGRNAEIFYDNFSDDKDIIVPKIYWEYTTLKVLTLQFVEGIKISNIEDIEKANIDKKSLAALLLNSYLKQFLIHRFFHGDPHPGNIFVQQGMSHNGSYQGPKLVFVDFGLMQKLPSQMREGLLNSGIAIIKRDTSGIVQGLIDLGFLSRKDDIRGIERVVGYFMEKYRDITPKEFKNIDINEISQEIHDLLQAYPSVQIPNNFILFARTMGMLNGISSKLDPDLNIIEIATPYAQRFAHEGKGWIEGTIAKGKELGISLTNIPKQLEDILRTSNRGEFHMYITSKDINNILGKIHSVLYRFLTLLTIVIFMLAYIFFQNNGRFVETILSGIATAIFTIVLICSFFRNK
ncbi:MAG: AarF/ABC1/UbiB kinase family protein [Nitrospirae bacterium]|nr:AarF/ABC1/UbiB kinase family protein [Nitrospirota bacterium]